MKIKKGNRTFPEGIYEAELKEVKIEDGKFEPGKTTISMNFKTNYGGEFGEAGWRIFRTCTFSLHPDSAFLPIAETLLGKKIQDGDEIDTDALIGKKCKLEIVNKENKKGRLASKVDKVLSVDSR